MDLTWSRFLSSFHKTGTSSNALAACTDHCGWRGGQGSISNCRDLLLMHWTRLLLSLHHRPHLHFPPLLSSSCSDCCSLSQALTFNHRKSVALSLAGKKIGADNSLLPPKRLGWSTMRQTHGAAWLIFRAVPTALATSSWCVRVCLPPSAAASSPLSHPACRDDVAVAISLGCNGEGRLFAVRAGICRKGGVGRGRALLPPPA